MSEVMAILYSVSAMASLFLNNICHSDLKFLYFLYKSISQAI